MVKKRGTLEEYTMATSRGFLVTTQPFHRREMNHPAETQSRVDLSWRLPASRCDFSRGIDSPAGRAEQLRFLSAFTDSFLPPWKSVRTSRITRSNESDSRQFVKFVAKVLLRVIFLSSTDPILPVDNLAELMINCAHWKLAVTDRPAIQATRVYSREETAEVLGVSLSTVKRLLAEGHLKAASLPGMRRVVITGGSLLRMLGEETAYSSAQPTPAFGQIMDNSRSRNGGQSG